MYEFITEGIHCGSCSNRIKKAVLSIDPTATVEVDIPAQRIQIQSSQPLATVAQAIEKAGYPVKSQRELH